MRKFIITSLVTVCLFLTACVYKLDIQQGNTISSDMIAQLKLGMTKEHVSFLLGEPVLVDTFDDDYWSYIYTFQPGHGKLQEKRVFLQFKNNALTQITRDTKSKEVPVLPKPQQTINTTQ